METDARPVWGIHMDKPGGDVPEGWLEEADALQGQGYVGIGWPDLGDLSTCADDRDAFRERFREVYGGSASAPTEGAAAGMLYRFVHVLHLGDVIVSPSPLGRIVRVGRVSGLYEYRPALLATFPNVRRVEWLAEPAPRNLSEAARRALRAQRSLFRILAGAEAFHALIAEPAPASGPFGEDTARPVR